MSSPPLLFALSLLFCLFSFSSAARAADEADFASLFGRAALPATPRDFPAETDQQWRRVLRNEKAEPSLGPEGSRLPAAEARHWLYFAGKAGRMDEAALLRGVNVFFNRFPARSDLDNYGTEEYWAGPGEFFRQRAGDCEDYVLAKYFALRVFGVADEKMRIVLVYGIREKRHHAVLAVSTSRGVYILDNNVRPKELILPQSHCAARYVPLYMLNERGRWFFNKAE